MPEKGSIINWWGTIYTVDSREEDRLKVTQGNGIQVTLWWQEKYNETMLIKKM